ncbi:MAG: 50S ribosomal protein L9 [Gammaproteobacteria bacterium]|nr:50S ribosomal protein L9 [Gammaproteobacteria bacterium]MDH5777146.1 50S ribosomal protein L9 [Gammaproteobacteria bacterium]
MDVILLEKVANLGNLGEQVSVKPGYGRNFLIPQKKAVPATADNVAKFEAQRAELEKAANEALAAATARAEQIAQLAKITIASHAGDEGKLFGSVAPLDIAEAMTNAGVAIEKREVMMPEGPIHNIGEYEIAIRVHSDVQQNITVVVEAAAE